MKFLNKYAIVLPSLLVLASISSANQSAEHDEYLVVALDNCEVVSKTQMTPEQLDAYLPLRDTEKLVEHLQIPMEEMESQLKVYTDQIEEIAELAIQETDSSIYIDKEFLLQQTEIAKKIENIVSFHQSDIDAIEAQGEEIGRQADIFQKAIEKRLQNIDYDQLRIISTEDDNGRYNCYKRSI